MKMNDNQILKEINEIDDLTLLVAILEVAAHKSGVLTISEMARREGCCPQTIRANDSYFKIIIGSQLMAIKIKERIPYEGLIK